jgi:capsular exopolysaccharide synthesis family protein
MSAANNHNGTVPPAYFRGRTAEDNDIELGGLLAKLGYHWPLYAGMALISVGASLGYLWYKQPTYLSSAKIYIKDDKKGGNELEALKELSLINSSKTVENEMEVIKSPLIMQDVIARNHFNIRIFRAGDILNRELYKNRPIELQIMGDSSAVGTWDLTLHQTGTHTWNLEATDIHNNKWPAMNITEGQPFSLGKDQFSLQRTAPDPARDFRIKVDSIGPLAFKKSAEIGTSLVSRDASVMQLTYEDPIPERSADLINALLSTYNKFTLGDKNQTMVNIIRFISSKLDSLYQDLNVLEVQEEAFKSQRGITEITENAKLALEQAKDADQKLGEANIQWSIYDQAEQYINNPGDSTPFAPVGGALDPALSAMINHYQELLSNKKRLGLSLQPGSSLMQNLNAQITEEASTIRKYIDGYRRNAGTARDQLRAKVNSMDTRIAEIPGYERDYINLKRQQSVKENLYVYLLQKKQESEISLASTIVDNKIIAYAPVPDKPIRPSKPLVFILFLAVGMGLVSAYLYIKYLLSTTILTRKEIEAIIDAPIVGEIGRQPEEPGLVKSTVLKEQLYHLRNNLRFMLEGTTAPPVILFISSISGEGKTFLSSHLASTLRTGNKQVVMLELDLRNPKLSQSLGMKREPGLSNYLIGSLTEEQILKPVPEQEGLYLISSGPIPPNPIELLEGSRLKKLLEWLKNRFDYIIIDCAPIGFVSDAKSLSAYTDLALFVVRYRHTPKSKLAEVVPNMGLSFPRLGVVFNSVRQDEPNKYYNYKYYSGGQENGGPKPLRQLLRQIKQRSL